MNAVQPVMNQSGQGIQVIARAAAILRVLKDSHAGMSLGKIAAAVGLPRSTVQRIINSLLAERLVMSASPSGGYRLGPEIQAMAAACRAHVAEMVRPAIAALSLKTGETVDLAEFRHDHMVFIDQVVGTHRLRTNSAVGEIFPMTTTANGKASLALLEDEVIAPLFRYEHPESDAVALDNFMQEIQQIRSRDYAEDLQEHSPGISAVGVAFFDDNQQVYAVSVPVPTPRFSESGAELHQNLLQTLADIRQLFHE